MNFDGLLSHIVSTHESLHLTAVRAVNRALSLRNWLVGWYIFEFEMNGEDRSQYGTQLFNQLAARLDHIRGFSSRNLYLSKHFYIAYPQFSSLLPETFQAFPILQSLTAEFAPPSFSVTSTVFPVDLEAWNDAIPAGRLIEQLSFTHFVELMKLEDPVKRCFYEMETMRGNWGVRELKRQIGSLYFERTGMSQRPELLMDQVGNASTPSSPEDVLKNVYAFEFLNLPASETVQESDLEKALLDQLENVMLELGHGFCFEARQKKVLIGDEYYFVDLLFYHRVLKCHIIIDLKIEAFSHASIGQLNTYVNYFRNEVMEPDDNPPIGILLVTDKNDTLVKYATGGLDENLFVKKYLVNLPSRKRLEEIVSRELMN